MADRGTRLDLGPLGPPDVARLAELAGAGQLSRRAAQRLAEHTAGVPLHVRELLHDLPAAALRTPGAALPAPRSLGTLVLSRLAACAPATEALVVAAAVLGMDSLLADVAALAGLADPLPALQEAASARILEPDGAAERRCVFGHALIRAAVYRDLGASRRAELHRGAARLATGAAALAHRTAGCQGADPALAADLRAQATAELAVGHRAEAAEHLLTAVQVAGPGPARDEWLLAAVGLLADLGDAARVHAYQAEVSALPTSAARSAVLSPLAMLAGEWGLAETWLAAARGALDPSRPPGEDAVREEVAAAACQLALTLLGQQRPDDAAWWALHASDTAVTSFTRACTCAVHGGCLASVGSAREPCVLLRAELARQDPGPGAALTGPAWPPAWTGATTWPARALSWPPRTPTAASPAADGAPARGHAGRGGRRLPVRRLGPGRGGRRAAGGAARRPGPGVAAAAGLPAGRLRRGRPRRLGGGRTVRCRRWGAGQRPRCQPGRAGHRADGAGRGQGRPGRGHRGRGSPGPGPATRTDPVRLLSWLAYADALAGWASGGRRAGAGRVRGAGQGPPAPVRAGRRGPRPRQPGGRPATAGRGAPRVRGQPGQPARAGHAAGGGSNPAGLRPVPRRNGQRRAALRELSAARWLFAGLALGPLPSAATPSSVRSPRPSGPPGSR